MPRPLNPDSGRYELKAGPELLRLWAAAAEVQGIELASWVRLVLTTTAKRVLAKHPLDDAAKAKKGKKR